MALVNQTLKLEITPGGVPPKLHVTEYDENMQIVAQLFQRGQYYEIPSGTTAKVEGTLAGHPFSADATVDGSNVTFELTKSMTAYAGRAWTKIKLTNDGKPVSTCGFWLECDRAGVEAWDVIGAPGFEEQIKDAVYEWLDEHGGVSMGLTTAQINALDGMFKVCAFIKDDVSAEYTAFKTAFGIADSGGETEVTLTSISATYDGGDVAVGTAVTDLTGIVVTAHYSDGSTETVTGYTLSGTIAEGSNTITVTYQGKTATFTVTGVAESGGEETGVSNETTWTDGVTYTYDVVVGECLGDDMTSGEIIQYSTWGRTPYLYCSGASKLRFEVVQATTMLGSNNNNKYCGFYDAGKNFIQRFGCDGIDSTTVGAYIDKDVPKNAVYFIVSHKIDVLSRPCLKFTPYA